MSLKDILTGEEFMNIPCAIVALARVLSVLKFTELDISVQCSLKTRQMVSRSSTAPKKRDKVSKLPFVLFLISIGSLAYTASRSHALNARVMCFISLIHNV